MLEKFFNPLNKNSLTNEDKHAYIYDYGLNDDIPTISLKISDYIEKCKLKKYSLSLALTSLKVKTDNSILQQKIIPLEKKLVRLSMVDKWRITKTN